MDAGGTISDRIGRGAYPLGVKAALQWDVVEGTLNPGERLLFHSDGLTEARNARDAEFGDTYVEVIAGWHPEGSAANLIDSILGEWRTFMGAAVPDDDVSIAVVKRT